MLYSLLSVIPEPLIQFCPARLNNNGTLDNSFNNGEIQVTPVSGADNEIQSIAIANNKV